MPNQRYVIMPCELGFVAVDTVPYRSHDQRSVRYDSYLIKRDGSVDRTTHKTTDGNCMYDYPHKLFYVPNDLILALRKVDRDTAHAVAKKSRETRGKKIPIKTVRKYLKTFENVELRAYSEPNK